MKVYSSSVKYRKPIHGSLFVTRYKVIGLYTKGTGETRCSRCPSVPVHIWSIQEVPSNMCPHRPRRQSGHDHTHPPPLCNEDKIILTSKVRQHMQYINEKAPHSFNQQIKINTKYTIS